eukprot:UN00203
MFFIFNTSYARSGINEQPAGTWKIHTVNEELVNLFDTNVRDVFFKYLNEHPTLQPAEPSTPSLKIAPRVISVRTQIVAGLNYQFTVLYMGVQYEVTAWRNLQSRWKLVSVKQIAQKH